MWFTRAQNGYNGWFAVVTSGGTLRGGLTSGSFVVTVRNPQDTASNVSTVIESGKSGLYKFNVTSSFLQTHGTGSYGIVVEISATMPTFRDAFVEVLQVYDSDFDSVTLSTIEVNNIVSGSAAAVWGSSTTGNTLSGTMGNLLLTASLPAAVSASISVDSSAIATAVWDKDISAYTTVGAAGTMLRNVSGSIGTISTDVAFIKSIEGGRWKIENNQMIFYDANNVAEVARFDLYDSAGAPTEDAVYERVRV